MINWTSTSAQQLVLLLLCNLFCLLLEAQSSDRHVSLIKVQKEGHYGYVNEAGIEVIPCIYDYLFDFHEGLVAGRIDSNWIYLNSAGEVHIDLKNRYGICGDFHDGKAYVSKGKMLISEYTQGYPYTNSKDIRYINRKGEEILHLNQKELNYYIDYPSTAYFSEGLLKVTCPYLPRSARTVHGYIDENGNWKIPPRFNSQHRFEEHFSEGLAAVGLHPYSQMKQEPRQRYGFINKKGEWVIMPDYNHVTSFQYGVALVTELQQTLKGGESWEEFYINKKGKRLFPDSVLANGNLFNPDLYDNKALGIFTKIADFKYRFALGDTLGNILTPFNLKLLIPGDLWAFEQDSLVGFMDDSAKVIIEPQYQRAQGFKQGLCVVVSIKEAGKYASGVINLKNEWVIPMQEVYQYEIKNGLILQFTRETRTSPTYLGRTGKEIPLSDYLFKKDDIQWVKKY